MNIGIGSFVFHNRKRNPQPATLFENHFFNVGGVGEGMEKAGSLFEVGLPLLLYSYICIMLILSFKPYRVMISLK